MGKNSKAQDAAMRREYQENRRRAEAEKQRRQNRLMWEIVAGIAVVVLVLSTIGIAVSCANQPPKMAELDFSEIAADAFTNTEDVTEYVRLNVTYTDKNGEEQTGDIVLRLYADVAPATVKNFQNLVGSDFYDGLTFHRVIENFMIQGGNPKGDGTGDSGKTVKGEFAANGVENNLLHKRGVLSMARGNSVNSASCQFFIVHKDSTHLDGQYAAFGYVVYGMDTVDGIAAIETDANDKPLDTVTINYASFVNVSK